MSTEILHMIANELFVLCGATWVEFITLGHRLEQLLSHSDQNIPPYGHIGDQSLCTAPAGSHGWPEKKPSSCV